MDPDEENNFELYSLDSKIKMKVIKFKNQHYQIHEA